MFCYYWFMKLPLGSGDFDKISTYLATSARPLDLTLYDFHFNGGDAGSVMKQLAVYQNVDGGFGNALEPDLRLPQSTALATWMAFRIMDEVGVASENEVLQCGLGYLIDSYDKSRIGWVIIRPEANDYPHAPWWEYKTAMAAFGWGNPSAELLGFLIKYGKTEMTDIVQALTQKALARIHEIDPADFHEILNFKALYELAGAELREQLKKPLERLIQRAVSTNPDEWEAYTAPPLRFISSPNDPFAHLFNQDLLRKNLDFLVGSIVNGDHWEPNWDWSGTYPSDWELARKEWSGQLTVRNMTILRAFGVRLNDT